MFVEGTLKAQCRINHSRPASNGASRAAVACTPSQSRTDHLRRAAGGGLGQSLPTTLALALGGHGVAEADTLFGLDFRNALVVGGTGNSMPSEQMMHQLFEQGIISDPDPAGVTCPADIWPLRGDLTFDQSVAVGVANLGAAMAESSRPIAVVGISQGAVVVNYEKSALIAQADPPAPQEILFVTIGDPTNSDGGLLAKLPHLHIPLLDATIPKAPVETPYNTIEIVHEYDGYADFPDNPFNLLAVLNAVAGVIYEDPNKSGVDLSDPRNVVTVSTNSLGGERPGMTGTRSSVDSVRTERTAPAATPSQLSVPEISTQSTAAEDDDTTEPATADTTEPATADTTEPEHPDTTGIA